MYNWEVTRQNYSTLQTAKGENRERYCCLEEAINVWNLRRQHTE